MIGRWKRTETNDHVFIEVTMFISIGVPENLDDLPPGFTDALRAAIKTTGADIITASIIPKHRSKFKSTARELLTKFSESINKQKPE